MECHSKKVWNALLEVSLCTDYLRLKVRRFHLRSETLEVASMFQGKYSRKKENEYESDVSIYRNEESSLQKISTEYITFSHN